MHFKAFKSIFSCFSPLYQFFELVSSQKNDNFFLFLNLAFLDIFCSFFCMPWVFATISEHFVRFCARSPLASFYRARLGQISKFEPYLVFLPKTARKLKKRGVQFFANFFVCHGYLQQFFKILSDFARGPL